MAEHDSESFVWRNIEVLLNGPIAPPTLHSKVPYSTVVHEIPIIEQYSLVQQYQSSYLVNGPSNEEYIWSLTMCESRSGVEEKL